jgi:hypothetical protein
MRIVLCKIFTCHREHAAGGLRGVIEGAVHAGMV